MSTKKDTAGDRAAGADHSTPVGDNGGQEPASRGIVTAAGRALGALLSTLLESASGSLDRGIGRAEGWLVDAKHARYGIAVTRMLLGLTALGLLASNFRTRLYAFGSGSAWNGEAAEPVSDFPNIWLFSGFHRLMLHDAAFTMAYLVLAILAVLVVLGWRMKIVLPVFFVGWVSFIELNDALTDQGDNMFRITVLALLFADTAGRWSLDARRRSRAGAVHGPWWKRAWHGEAYVPAWLSNSAHNLVLAAITCHVCFVYASGSLYKAGGTPWQEGYAIYNPLHTQVFGPWPELSDLFTSWGPMVAVISWSSIILQMAFPMMLLRRPTRIIALLGIGSFHVGIAVLMGLPWFSLAMIAIDAIFIRDVTWARLGHAVSTTWQQARRGDRAPSPPEESAADELDSPSTLDTPVPN